MNVNTIQVLGFTEIKLAQWNSLERATPFSELLWTLLMGGHSWGVFIVKNNRIT